MEKSKNWIYDDVLFCKSSLSKMASVKTKQNQKSDDAFEKPTFQYIQLCCLVQKDSTTLKLLKSHSPSAVQPIKIDLNKKSFLK